MRKHLVPLLFGLLLAAGPSMAATGADCALDARRQAAGAPGAINPNFQKSYVAAFELCMTRKEPGPEELANIEPAGVTVITPPKKVKKPAKRKKVRPKLLVVPVSD